jgi:uncharacterized BrkB/YihY/UPF0761 family membrane protein
MIDKDSIITGILLGAIVPVFGFIVIEFIFELFGQLGLMDVVSGTNSRRMRTLALLGICCNLIPFNYSRRQKWDETMRGIVFPTLVYVAGWVFKYYSVLF